MIIELLQTAIFLDRLLFWIVTFSFIWIALKFTPKIWLFIRQIFFDCISIYTAIQQAKVDVSRMGDNANYLEAERQAKLEAWKENQKLLIDSNRLQLRAGLPAFIPAEHDIELEEIE